MKSLKVIRTQSLWSVFPTVRLSLVETSLTLISRAAYVYGSVLAPR